ncbi:MAG: SDR family NAD(P)-dependent oxidoreductase [Actinomycetota bacterium]|nr:SDR family NAD(P)-dependent oxidoreductase [Actinomycetota bacterium]
MTRPAAGPVAAARGIAVPAGAVAVVTGASRGLGAGLAAAFASAGLRLGLCARHVPPSPGGRDPGITRASVDVADADALEKFANHVVEKYGRIDMWVNNAGILEPVGALRDASFAGIRRNIEVNLMGVAYGSAIFARHVHSRPGGGILVNVSSGAAKHPYEGWAAYCASKAGVDQLTEVLAAEEARFGLRAYALAPGVIETDMQALVRATPPERFPAAPRFVELHRSGRFNSAERVASYALSLAFGESPGDDIDRDAVVHRVPGRGGE